jgi:hypothetical protein
MSAPASEPPQNQLLATYQAWQAKTAYVTRAIIISVGVLSVLSLIGLDLTMYLGNTPAFSVFHFEIYRLVLSPLVGNSIITLIIMLFFFPAMGTQMEQQMGSAAFGGLVVSLTLIINFTFAFACTFLSFFGMPEALLQECAGFWVVLFAIITIDCQKQPDAPRRLMCFPCDIPSMYFPLALFGFFCLFGGFQLSFAVAIVVGFAWSRGMLDKAKLSDSFVESLEESGGLLYNTSRDATGWIFTVRGGDGGSAPGGGGAYSAVRTNEPMNRGGFGGASASDAGAGGNAAGSAKPAEKFPGHGNAAGGTRAVADDMKARRLAALAEKV